MILTDKLIVESVENGTLKIEPFDKNTVQPASYDLKVGADAMTSSLRKKKIRGWHR